MNTQSSRGKLLVPCADQIASLFDRDKSVISSHLRNVFATGELERDPAVAFFATVQTEAGRKVERTIEHFNLDAIRSYQEKGRAGVRASDRRE